MPFGILDWLLGASTSLPYVPAGVGGKRGKAKRRVANKQARAARRRRR